MPAAKLTIVIPARNRAGLLPRTLDSVAKQTLRPLKVVLVDNGSTDGTLEVMHSWAHEDHGIDVTVLQEQKPGAAAARNLGLSVVDTEWTMFFDSDDTMAPDHCQRAMSCSAGVEVVGWDIMYHAGGRQSVKRFYEKNAQFNSLFHGGMATQRYMALTSLFRRAGCWNPEVMYWNDIELGARLLALNPRMRHAGRRITVDMYGQRESITGTDFSSRIEPATVALSEIAATLQGRGDAAVDVKTAILAANSAKEGSLKGHELFERLLEGKNWRRKLLLYAAYYYQRAGGRGTARLLRAFL